MNQDTQAILNKMTTLSEGERAIWTNALNSLAEHIKNIISATARCDDALQAFVDEKMTPEEVEPFHITLNDVHNDYLRFFVTMPEELQTLVEYSQEIQFDLLITQQAE